MTVAQAIKSSFISNENNTFSFFIGKDFPAFKGHFPGAPLLPGTVQIEIALFCVERILGKKVSISEIKKAKFIKPLLPDTEITVSINENNGSYSVSINGINEVYSQMKIIVKEGE
ncbi:MAG: hypothetical protein FWG57_02675 [Endomicrobia bacterium]|nr:hypothetical protein [Endomicrobiia bacterium]